VASERELAAIVQQHSGTDDALQLTVEEHVVESAASAEHTRRILDLLSAIPTGVLAMSPALPGVVETSTSLTTAVTTDGTLTLGSMTRSSNAAALDGALAAAQAIARLGGAEIEIRRSYPPWEPAPDSPLLTAAAGAYTRLFGDDPARTIVHGGLECAVLGQRLDGVEMISIGAEIVGPHAPGEKVRISSTQRFYRLLGALLEELSR
jgi:dipeptidase D